MTGVETNRKKTLSSDPTVLSVLSLAHTHPDHSRHVKYIFNQESGNKYQKKFLVCKCSALEPLVGNMAPYSTKVCKLTAIFKLAVVIFLVLIGLRKVTLLQAKRAWDKLPLRTPGTV